MTAQDLANDVPGPFHPSSLSPVALLWEYHKINFVEACQPTSRVVESYSSMTKCRRPVTSAWGSGHLVSDVLFLSDERSS